MERECEEGQEHGAGHVEAPPTLKRFEGQSSAVMTLDETGVADKRKLGRNESFLVLALRGGDSILYTLVLALRGSDFIFCTSSC